MASTNFEEAVRIINGLEVAMILVRIPVLSLLLAAYASLAFCKTRTVTLTFDDLPLAGQMIRLRLGPLPLPS